MAGKKIKALKAAFPHTIPIFAGFWFLGMTYGIYMNASGFSFWYPMVMSAAIFAGSMEFITANMLLGAFDPIQAEPFVICYWYSLCFEKNIRSFTGGYFFDLYRKR